MNLVVLAVSSHRALTFAMIIVSVILTTGVVPICDREILLQLKNEKNLSYGNVRLWGAVGWGIGAVGLGFLLDQVADLAFMFYSQAAFFVIVTFSAAILPFTILSATNSPDKTTTNNERTRSDSVHDVPLETEPSNDVPAEVTTTKLQHNNQSRLQALKSLVRVDVVIFFVTVLSQVRLDSQRNVILKKFFSEGNDDGMFGNESIHLHSVAWRNKIAARCVAAIHLPRRSADLLLLRPNGESALGERRHLSGDLCDDAANARALPDCSFANSLGDAVHRGCLSEAWLFFVINFCYQLLHGITFGLMWCACVRYANEIAPKTFESTTQGLLNSLYWGAGNGWQFRCVVLCFASDPLTNANEFRSRWIDRVCDIYIVLISVL